MTVFNSSSSNVGVTVLRGNPRHPNLLTLRLATEDGVVKVVEKKYKMSWRRAKQKIKARVVAIGGSFTTKPKAVL